MRVQPLKSQYLFACSVVRFTIATTVLTVSMVGCASQKATVCDLDYCDDISGISHYRERTSQVSYPCIDTPTTEAVASSIEPRNVQRRVEDTPREISLQDALLSALNQNEIIETSALGGVGSKAVLTNPDVVASVYDPAIQSSGVLFGRRGVEAALTDFDATFDSTLNFSRSDLNPGGSFAGGGNAAAFRSSLRKQFANGGSLSLNNDWNYSTDIPNSGSNPINYFGGIGAEYRQPLLAGSGVDYTRIAGPANPNFGAITGVSQGVVIARINQDISVADFEVSVRNALRDIENAYWDLYLTYRTYDTAVVAHQSAFQTWRESQDRLEVGVLKPADELQARDRLYETKASVETTLNGLYQAESELRRLIGLPMNDGTTLVPIDKPLMAEFQPDWRASLRQALTHRVELRRQKWTVKSLQLQLQAARSLVRPRFDFVAGYDVQGAGDNLISENGNLGSAFGSVTNEDINSWNLGFEVSMPLGFRFTRTQVRNLELQVTKATAVLASQEKNIAHDIATSIQDITSAFTAAQSNRKRLEAAARRVELLETEREIGTATLDLVLRAQSSLAAAESSYYQQLVNYNKALTSLHFSTGSLLAQNGVSLAEGPWCPEAKCDALLRAHSRTHAKDAPYLCTQPAEFSSEGPTGAVNLHESYENHPPNSYDTEIPSVLPPGEPEEGAGAFVDPELEPLPELPVRKAFRRASHPSNIQGDFPGTLIQ